MKRFTVSKTKLRNLSCGFIYSRSTMGQQSIILLYQQNFSHPLNRISSLRILGYNKMREDSITLVTQNEFFLSSNLFQSNCIHRSNEQVKQATCFNFPEMPRLLTQHEGRGLRTGRHIIGPRARWRINLITLFFSHLPWYPCIFIQKIQKIG